MRKIIVAGTAALLLAGSTLAYAQQRGGGEGQRWRPNAEDSRAFGEARLAALRAGLSLNADQEKNWPAFEQAARDFAKFRADRFAARRDAMQARGDNDQPADPIDRARTRAKAMADTAAGLQRLVDATEPLYRSLDEAQKRRFAVLARGVTPGMGRGFEGRTEGRGFEGRRHREWRRDRDDNRDRDRPRRYERMRGDNSQGDGDPRFQRGPRAL
jgi:hypothetical protein